MTQEAVIAICLLYAIVTLGFWLGIGDAMDDLSPTFDGEAWFAFALALIWPITTVLFLSRRFAAWLTGGA